MGLRSGLWHAGKFFHAELKKTKTCFSLWSWLCARILCRIETGKAQTQTCFLTWEYFGCLKSLNGITGACKNSAKQLPPNSFFWGVKSFKEVSLFWSVKCQEFNCKMSTTLMFVGGRSGAYFLLNFANFHGAWKVKKVFSRKINTPAIHKIKK